MKNIFEHKLMHDNITETDLKSVRSFLQNKPRLTQSKKVKIFEEKWSKWLGVKYSTFVNSGATSNYISIAILKYLGHSGEIIVPTLTWPSDVSAVILNGFKPVFVDINLRNLCMLEEDILRKINKRTVAVFITYAQGFNGLSKNLLSVLKKKKIFLIEDVCESHGATFNNKKLGSYGLISNFSFYYAHHMTTIEGGMICTNSSKINNFSKVFRSHGMLRESPYIKYKKNIVNNYPDLNPEFIFISPSLNFRSTEIQAVMGINQIKNLDKNNKLRIKNFNIFINSLNKDIFFTDFETQGSCNYAFPVILRHSRIKLKKILEDKMKKNNIEFRLGNAGGGNQLRQPYLKNFTKRINLNKFKNVEHVHFYGYYIGNYPSLEKEKILKICKILNSIND